MVAIIVGTSLIGLNQNRWNAVILTLPRGHGIHIRDVFGMALVALGSVLLWRAPRA